MKPAPTPHLQSMVLCDRVIREAGTNKPSLIGVLDVIYGDTYPVGHGRIVLFARFTAVPGSYRMRYVLRHLSGEGRVVDVFSGQRVTSEDRLRPVEVIVAFRDLVFEAPGRYALEMYANERRIGDSTFRVTRPGD